MELVKGMTKPGSLLKEHDLIGLMEKYSIGTDCTISAHIKNIETRGLAF